MMTRPSLADELYEKHEDVPDGRGKEWMLIYDFTGKKPPVNFWLNLRRLSGHAEGSYLLQRSVFVTRSKRVLLAARDLPVHYGGSVEAFRVEREI